jgi:hypothetical protein
MALQQCVVSAALLGTVILPKGRASGENQKANIVIREPYIWHLIWGNRNQEKLDSQVAEMEILEDRQKATQLGPGQAV